MGDEGRSSNRRFDLEDRMIDFSARVMNVVEALPSTRVGSHVAAQRLRCGTAPASNDGEAQSAESRSDCVHKMKIALKELRETCVWLLTIQRAPLLKASKPTPVLSECNGLIAIFVASMRTAQNSNRAATARP